MYGAATRMRSAGLADWGRTPMGDKSPKKPNGKKPGKSLKEKRADKNAKRDGKKPGFGA